MNRFPSLRSALASCAAIALILAVGCGRGETQPANQVDRLVAEVAVPTQEEADRRAAAEITEENADEVFERLLREIEEDEP